MAVLVGTVTDDVRLFVVPKMQVACLRATETARARILAVSAHIDKAVVSTVAIMPYRMSVPYGEVSACRIGTQLSLPAVTHTALRGLDLKTCLPCPVHGCWQCSRACSSTL